MSSFRRRLHVEQMLALGHASFGNIPVAITHLELDQLLTLDRPRLVHVERDERSGRTRISSEPDIPDEPWVYALSGAGDAFGRRVAKRLRFRGGSPAKVVPIDEAVRPL